MTNHVLRFKTDIDAAFALAYHSLGASKQLFQKRHKRFVQYYGKELDSVMNTCNRRELDTTARDHYAGALDCGRRHIFELAKKWVQGAEASHKELDDIIEGLWE
jgi:hypothetical protein